MGNIWTVDTSGNLTTDGGVSALGTMFAAAFDTNVAAAGVVLGGTSLVALGTDVNIDITITPKGSGSLIMSKVDIGAGAIDATTVGSVTPAAGAFTTLAATSLSLSGALTVTLLNLYDTDASNTLGIAWNENDTVNRVLNLYVSGANRALTIKIGRAHV